MTKRRDRRQAWWLLPLVLCLLPACQQRMARQPSYREDEPTPFFPDGQAARPPVSGTVARGHLRTDTHLFGESALQWRQAESTVAAAVLGTGAGNLLGLLTTTAAAASGGEYSTITTFPFPVTAKVLEHGRNRYMIYCIVCHDAAGTGQGKIVERGYTRPPSYHIERLRQAPVGHYFEVATRGYGSMPAYGPQVPPRDRWAIIAYIRALQLSQHFPESELTPELRREWQEKRQAGAEGGQP